MQQSKDTPWKWASPTDNSDFSNFSLSKGMAHRVLCRARYALLEVLYFCLSPLMTKCFDCPELAIK